MTQPPSRTIGLLGTGLVTIMQNQLWQGAVKAAQEHNVKLIFYPTISLSSYPAFTPQTKVLFELVDATMIDGLLIWYAGIAEGVGVDSAPNFFDRYAPLPIITVGGQSGKYPDLSIDNYQGVYTAVEHLIQVHGRRHIFTIRGSVGHPDADARYQGYVDALHAHGLTLNPDGVAESLFELRSSATMAEAAVNQWLQNEATPPDAIVTGSDYMALAAVKAIEAYGLRVPDDIAVVGFDDVDDSQASIPSVATVHQPFEELGYQAIKMLLALMDGENVPFRSVMPAQFVPRESCGCLMKSRVNISDSDQELLDLIPQIAHSLGIPVTELVQWVDLLQNDLRAGTSQQFLPALNHQLAVFLKSRFELTTWQNAILLLRRYLMSLPDGELDLSGETLFDQAQALVTEAFQRTHIRQRLQAERQIEDLRRTSEALITAFGTQLLVDTLYEQLPTLGFPSFYLSLYDDPLHPAASAHLILAYDQGQRLALPPEGLRFPTPQLIPQALLSSRSTAPIVVEPLYFREQQLGILVLEAGPAEGVIYENLRTQISSAIQGSQLLQQVQQHAAQLEQRVGERTTELSHTVTRLQTEITERQRAEKALRANSFVLERSSDAVYWITADAQIVEVNRAACQMLDYTYDEFTKMSLGDIDPAFVFEQWLMGWKLTQKDQLPPLERIHRAKDGRLIPVELISNYIAFDDQELICVFARDITQRKQAEAALRESEFFLQKSQTVGRIGSYYMNIINDSWINSPMLNMLFGISTAYPRNTQGWLALVHPEQQEEMRQYFSDYVLAGHNRFDKEYRIIRYEDQQELWVHGFGELEFDDSGQAVKMIGTIQDVTPRKQAEAALQQKQEEERQLLAYLKTLHEISIELTITDRLDEFYRQVVELGLKRLEFDRMGLWLYDPDQKVARGTYGTDMQGKVQPESHLVLELNDEDGIYESLLKRGQFIHQEYGKLYHNLQVIETGWKVTVALWYGDHIHGWLSVDNLIHHQPISQAQLEVFGQYGILVATALARKQVEVALRESEFFLQKSQTVGHIGSYYFDATTDCLTCSPMLDTLFGIDDHYLKNTEGWLALVHPEQQEEMRRYFSQHVLAGRNRFDKEYRIIRQNDQQERWVHGFGELEFDEQGQTVKMIGTIQDITERKRAEIELREREEYAREFQEKLKALQEISLELAAFEALDALCCQAIELGHNRLGYDRMGLLLFENAEKTKVSRFGIESNGELRVAHEMDYHANQDPAYNLLTNREAIYLKEDAVLGDFEDAVGHGWNVVTGIWDADRYIGWLAADNYFEKKPLISYQVELLRLYGLTIGHLVTSKRAEAEIRRLNDQLEHRVAERTQQLEAVNRELESFAYSVSHDLRAPLRSIDGFSQALLEDYVDRLDDDGRDYLRRVRQATVRMGGLIDDLLQLSRVTRRGMQLETVDLSSIAEQIVATLREAKPERMIEWVILPGMKVQGDSGLLRVLLENLLRNAWKFTAKHERAQIEFGCEAQDGKLVFFVRDDGAGFDMAYADKLFGAFQRLHRSDEFEGTGIGLATVQRIIQRHGGQVWARGAIEQGATFFFTISPNP